MTSPFRAPAAVVFYSLFSVSVLVCMFLSTPLLHPATMAVESDDIKLQIPPPEKIEFPPPDCTSYNRTGTCPANRGRENDQDRPSGSTCPEYFRWIHEDLRPWAATGITPEMVKSAAAAASFRLVVVEGKAYVEKYRNTYETRGTFTLWGILQLLRRYPGKIPDLDLMFRSEDNPDVAKQDYVGNATGPPPLFGYSGDDDTLDIVFPDWSFWGWPELNIKPWDALLEDIKEGNKRKKWLEREPYAYWKGNPLASKAMHDLLTCNLSRHQHHDWNVRAYLQNWTKEFKGGFEESNLGNQCDHRYKIYTEGVGWSLVSDKHTLACDSMTLLVRPKYHDFFIRGLMPMVHYWPIKPYDMCKSIKFAVGWGNTFQEKPQAIGKAASKFIQDEVNMENVYDYMFHSLNEYSKLLTFKPTKPPYAAEICHEAVACSAEGLAGKFMTDSMVKHPAATNPCLLLPPFHSFFLNSIRQIKENSIRQIKNRETKFWDKVEQISKTET